MYIHTRILTIYSNNSSNSSNRHTIIITDTNDLLTSRNFSASRM